jgi:LPS sulfotransferase NodH
MDATGVMGRPHEWLGWWRTRGTRDGTLAGAHEAATKGRTANGVAGIKLFPFYLEVALRHLRFSRWFPDAVWVHLVRRDTLGQALSLWRASENAAWFDVRGAQTAAPLPQPGQVTKQEVSHEAPPYDREEIARALEQIVAYEADWRRFFARTGITPVPLVYEEVMADPAHALRTVADAVGVSLPAGTRIGPTAFAIQRDEQTEAARARFLAEAGDPDAPFQSLRSFGRKERQQSNSTPGGVGRVVGLLRRRALKAR